MQKILVTGAAGKIGQDVTRFLDKQGNYQLRLADINLSALETFKDTNHISRCF
ncbi:hypothetical protein BACERE00177_03399 [Bacillus mobilis]|nr:Protein of unknown function [Bacillus mobilis]SME23767.1 hypothetical protein BACERE00177_03399 [Bacillus mobilis]